MSTTIPALSFYLLPAHTLSPPFLRFFNQFLALFSTGVNNTYFGQVLILFLLISLIIHTHRGRTKSLLYISLHRAKYRPRTQLNVEYGEQECLRTTWECQAACKRSKLMTYQKWKHENSEKHTWPNQRPTLEVCGKQNLKIFFTSGFTIEYLFKFAYILTFLSKQRHQITKVTLLSRGIGWESQVKGGYTKY